MVLREGPKEKNYVNGAEGFYGSARKTVKVAREYAHRADRYAYRDRKTLKREMRYLWQIRIGAACRLHNLSYSKFVSGLKLAKIDLDRKILADIAVRYPDHFTRLVELARPQAA